MLKGLNKIQKFFKHKFYDSYHSTYIFPFLFVSSTFGFSFSIQTFFPSNDKFKTHFRSRVYESKLVDKNKRSLLKNFFDSSLDINRLIFEEDAEICSKIVKTENHFIGPIADTESPTRRRIMHHQRSALSIPSQRCDRKSPTMGKKNHGGAHSSEIQAVLNNSEKAMREISRNVVPTTK